MPCFTLESNDSNLPAYKVSDATYYYGQAVGSIENMINYIIFVLRSSISVVHQRTYCQVCVDLCWLLMPDKMIDVHRHWSLVLKITMQEKFQCVYGCSCVSSQVFKPNKWPSKHHIFAIWLRVSFKAFEIVLCLFMHVALHEAANEAANSAYTHDHSSFYSIILSQNYQSDFYMIFYPFTSVFFFLLPFLLLVQFLIHFNNIINNNISKINKKMKYF